VSPMPHFARVRMLQPDRCLNAWSTRFGTSTDDDRYGERERQILDQKPSVEPLSRWSHSTSASRRGPAGSESRRSRALRAFSASRRHPPRSAQPGNGSGLARFAFDRTTRALSADAVSFESLLPCTARVRPSSPGRGGCLVRIGPARSTSRGIQCEERCRGSSSWVTAKTAPA